MLHVLEMFIVTYLVHFVNAFQVPPAEPEPDNTEVESQLDPELLNQQQHERHMLREQFTAEAKSLLAAVLLTSIGWNRSSAQQSGFGRAVRGKHLRCGRLPECFCVNKCVSGRVTMYRHRGM